MILAGSFQDAAEAALPNCREWIFLGNGQTYSAPELKEIAAEYDDKTPLGDENILVVTGDGSIGLLYPYCREPSWYFVSAAFAVANILHEDAQKYMVPSEAAFVCKSCGAKLQPGSRFCENCGAKITLRFCENCGARLPEGAKFCENCGTKV
ncbi:MAG: zinc ribbon domain-containing protein [Schwartzia sp.]|nr:zinc ribbon domain-containing protein [Schwartzia sp. (in: firmicutes)]MBR1886395.1 zinc ribbon domain-containing protein [Schwartzia sp. (in: firmicutes)]